ncbi:zinc finger protein ZAT5-like [Rhodamnia argentea]|uniref:Zinc finger protein ZAT5-like n=1 Tax=Rhodamnia argentea TaxID=178133 RepID=A0A8B8PMH3_9MYRT|nr:zinc finger protein ZAT5-like [Rhodamnia argentea]
MDRFVGSDNREQVVKGKRTKRRQRLSAAHLEAAMTTTTLSCGGIDDNSLILSSLSSMVDMGESGTSEHQEEDMANCLILLAQGKVPRQVEDEKGGQEVYTSDPKWRSNGCVQSYKCKTCGRMFTSFQALGGHRSSHMKKPKSRGQEKLVKSSPREDRDNDTGQLLGHSGTKMYAGHDKVNTKMRKCSICGLQFKSGQALGGHMRRHRALSGGTPHVSITSLEIALHADQKRRGNILPLDLNLPAPEHDVGLYSSQIHHLSPATSQQTSPMLSAAATLVECLY